LSSRSPAIPAGFTLLYLVAAFVFGPAMDQGSWIRLGRILALGLAAVSAIVLWVIYGVFWARGAPRSLGALILTGLLCPAVVTTSVFEVTGLVRRAHERRTARQLAHSRISKVRDELLLGPAGNPIGVRIRYNIAYQDGLDDLHYAPFATVHLNDPAGNLLPRSKEVSPAVGKRYEKSDYRFTEDHVPMFLPPRLIFPESKDSCLRWANEDQRTAVLQSPPQRYPIVIQPYHQQSETASEYTLKAFYRGALREGAVECPKD
jgi:hypothetical protein